MQETRQVIAMPTLSHILVSAPFCNIKQNVVTDKISEIDKTFFAENANVDKITNTAVNITTSIAKKQMFFDEIYSAEKYFSSLKIINSEETAKNDIINEARIFLKQ